jgi:hypothetical protein
MEVDACLFGGDVIYPHRADLSHKIFWRCQNCGNYVGCHPGGNKPLGNIPTPELRKARGHIHALLDPLWKSKKAPRGRLYARISQEIGRQYHTGEIRSVEEAREIYRIVQGLSKELSQ